MAKKSKSTDQTKALGILESNPKSTHEIARALLVLPDTEVRQVDGMESWSLPIAGADVQICVRIF